MEELRNTLSKYFYVDINVIIISLLYDKCEKCNEYKEDMHETFEHKYVCDDCLKIYIYKTCIDCNLQYDYVDGDFCVSCCSCCIYYCNYCLFDQLQDIAKLGSFDKIGLV